MLRLFIGCVMYIHYINPCSYTLFIYIFNVYVNFFLLVSLLACLIISSFIFCKVSKLMNFYVVCLELFSIFFELLKNCFLYSSHCRFSATCFVPHVQYVIGLFLFLFLHFSLLEWMSLVSCFGKTWFARLCLH